MDIVVRLVILCVSKFTEWFVAGILPSLMVALLFWARDRINDKKAAKQRLISMMNEIMWISYSLGNYKRMQNSCSELSDSHGFTDAGDIISTINYESLILSKDKEYMLNVIRYDINALAHQYKYDNSVIDNIVFKFVEKARNVAWDQDTVANMASKYMAIFNEYIHGNIPSQDVLYYL